MDLAWLVGLWRSFRGLGGGVVDGVARVGTVLFGGTEGRAPRGWWVDRAIGLRVVQESAVTVQNCTFAVGILARESDAMPDLHHRLYSSK